MTNDSPVYILPLVNYNAPLPFKYSICGVSLNADFIPHIYYKLKIFYFKNNLYKNYITFFTA